MDYVAETNTWTRTCPQCKLTVEHKNKAKCRVAERLNSPCSKCSRSNNGKSNSKTDSCPICNETIRVPAVIYNNVTCELETHAALHEATPEQLWLKKHRVAEPPKCKCGCGGTCKWTSWWNGYNEFIIGHNAAIHSGVYSKEEEERLALTRGINWRGKPSMWLNKTKENDPRIAARGEAISSGRKKAFAEGKIEIWSKGKTVETDQRLAELAKQAKEKFASGDRVAWHKGLTKETDERLAAMALKVSMTHRSKHIREKLDAMKRYSHDEIREMVEKNGNLRLVDDLSSYVNYMSPILVECKTCGNQSRHQLRKAATGRCWTCDPSGSAAQLEISDYISNVLGVPANVNDRITIFNKETGRGLELDIYVPTHNIAIEYNGLYWHNETTKTSTYHNNKTVQCAENNIKLIHIFEDEWRDKKHIVQSMIQHALGLTKNRVNARQCDVVKLTSKERRDFFVQNHIDGDVAAFAAIALKKDGVTVASMSFRKPVHKKHDGSLEVARFCVLAGMSVVGALGKLTSEAKNLARENSYKKLLTYVDTRLGGVGKSWEATGWKQASMTGPRFWWTDNTHRFNRFKYKANKSQGITEAQVAIDAGVVKIWGCNNLIYELELT